METDFNFKSQICTTREQSERLLALGLKPETADMVWHYTKSRSETMKWELQPHPPVTMNNFHGNISKLNIFKQKNSYGEVMTGEEYFHELWGRDIPAWSLHRLYELYNSTTPLIESVQLIPYLYDIIINKLEVLIEKGYFPKEYLVLV